MGMSILARRSLSASVKRGSFFQVPSTPQFHSYSQNRVSLLNIFSRLARKPLSREGSTAQNIEVDSSLNLTLSVLPIIMKISSGT
jgi:hypothetical protein